MPSFEKIRKKLQAKLKGFTNDFPNELSRWEMVSFHPDEAEFPVPELVLLALRDILEFRWSGTGEKVRWSVYACVAGDPFVFELRKFGFTILYRKGSSVSLSRVAGQLKSGLSLLEGFLKEAVDDQTREGCVSIANHDSEFQGRYHFFRSLAAEAYSRANMKVSENANGFPNIAAVLNHNHAALRDGFFHSTAMVDAFFRALEHRMILLRAFTGRPLAAGELRQFLDLKWDQKLKDVVGSPANQESELLLGHLRIIKERIRNPFAHGGMENDGGSLFVHFPTVGAIPANFSRFKNSARFNVIPIEKEAFEDFCATFDKLDEVLKGGLLARPFQLLKAGIDAAFDPATLAEYADAGIDDERLESFIERWDYEWTQHANMDYF